MTQDRLVGDMDRAMAAVLEKRLVALLEASNSRDEAAGRPPSRLSRPAGELAAEPRDFEGFVRCTPLGADGLKDGSVGSYMGITPSDQAPFVTASLLVAATPPPGAGPRLGSSACAHEPPVAPCPAHPEGGTRPRWRRRNPFGGGGAGGGGGGSDGSVRCLLNLPLPRAARMRPVLTLRLECLAMDRAFGHALLGSAEVRSGDSSAQAHRRSHARRRGARRLVERTSLREAEGLRGRRRRVERRCTSFAFSRRRALKTHPPSPFAPLRCVAGFIQGLYGPVAKGSRRGSS